MSKPMVVAVMLVNGRKEMVERAIASFESQIYPAGYRALLILDTGEPTGKTDVIQSKPVIVPSAQVMSLRLRTAVQKTGVFR